MLEQINPDNFNSTILAIFCNNTFIYRKLEDYLAHNSKFHKNFKFITSFYILLQIIIFF